MAPDSKTETGSPPPAGAAALRQATILLPDEGERNLVLGRLDGGFEETPAGPLVRDPSGNTLLLSLT